jgi:hypothetical protein
MRRLVLVLIVMAGLAAVVISGSNTLRDWAALKVRLGEFEVLAAHGADLPALFVAEARQNVHRVNCFAEGIGVLLGAILAAIGLHGLCLLPKSRRSGGEWEDTASNS